MGGCCGTRMSVIIKPEPPYSGSDSDGRLIERDEKYYYDVTFPSRPLCVIVTSSKSRIDSYFTAVSELCPVSNALETIVLGSKVAYVNEQLVEGCPVNVFAECIAR